MAVPVKTTAEDEKMKKPDLWLKCNVSSGILPGEYAIEAKRADGRTISFFASEEYVKPAQRLVRVVLLDKSPDSFLIYLPASPLEVSSRSMRVSREDIANY